MNFNSDLTAKKEVGYHVAFWLLVAYFTLLDYNGASPTNFSVQRPDILSLFWALVFVISFYFNYLVLLPWVFKHLNWGRSILGLALFYIFFAFLRYLMEEITMPYFFNYSNYAEGTPIQYYLIDNLYYCTLPLIPSSIFWLIVYLIRLLKNHASLSEEKRNMEVKLLKSQLNPHFLFNTLNNIYSLVYMKSEKALPAIDKLSGIMRFTTYESQKDFIWLQDELDYMNSLIELEQLRHERGINILIQSDTDKTTIKIPPLLLTPLVENSIKHGSFDEHHPIEIALTCGDSKMIFTVKNRIGKQKKDRLNGIGLDNLKKRLQLYYPGKHRLDIENKGGFFKTKLEIEY